MFESWCGKMGVEGAYVKVCEAGEKGKSFSQNLTSQLRKNL